MATRRRMRRLAEHVAGCADDSSSNQNSSQSLSDRRDDDASQPFPTTLTAGELESFDRDGFVVVRSAISRALAREIEAHLYTQLGMDAATSESWYPPTDSRPLAGPQYNVSLPATPVWARLQLELAQSPRLLGAYAQLWGTRRLWVLPSKRGSFKPPLRPGAVTAKHISAHGQVELPLGGRLPMHWDVAGIESGAFDDPANQYFDLQSSLFVAASGSDGGGTCLVPGFHREWAAWIRTARGRLEIARMSHKDSRNHPRMRHVSNQIVTPAGDAGDLLIWQNFLPHGSSANTSQAPRMRLGVTVRPAPPPTATFDSAYSEQRATWAECLAAAAQCREHGENGALLSEVGRRAIGLAGWADDESRAGLDHFVDRSAAYLAGLRKQ